MCICNARGSPTEHNSVVFLPRCELVRGEYTRVGRAINLGPLGVPRHPMKRGRGLAVGGTSLIIPRGDLTCPVPRTVRAHASSVRCWRSNSQTRCGPVDAKGREGRKRRRGVVLLWGPLLYTYPREHDGWRKRGKRKSSAIGQLCLIGFLVPLT